MMNPTKMQGVIVPESEVAAGLGFKTVDDFRAWRDSNSVTMEELKVFSKLVCAYLSRDAEDREGIASMASIANDPYATNEEIEAALETLREVLYPTESIKLRP